MSYLQYFRAVALLSLVAASCAAAVPPRIQNRISSENTFRLMGNVSPVLQGGVDHGEVQPSFVLPRITLHFQKTAAQEADLAKLLAAQQDRTSPQFHKWLTPEQFGARFGLAEADINKVQAWLESAGFSEISVSPSRTSVSMTGTAAHVQNAFGVGIHQMQTARGLRWGNLEEPQMPTALKNVVSAVRGLNNVRPHPRIRVRPVPHFTSNLTGNHFLTPDDFATIYDLKPLYQRGINGSGEKIVIPAQSDIQTSDIDTFRSNAGLSPNEPQIVHDSSSTDPGIVSGDEDESELDIEWAGGVAPNATIVLVVSKNALDAVDYAIQNNLGPVMSVTYGLCESDMGRSSADAFNSDFQQANAQGMTILAAAGDTGAADCDGGTGTGSNPTPPAQASKGLAVDFPGSSPYVTDVGGTTFSEGTGSYWSTSNSSAQGSVQGYIPEAVWNDTANNGTLAASGGGASGFYSKPSWQQGTGVPGDNQRDVPDVALNASGDHDGYVTCIASSCTNGFRDSNQNLNVSGGTSASTPSMAGVVALIVQATGSPQGNINPTLYSLASISTDAFHDVTTGNNQVPCKAGTPNCGTSGMFGYSAGVGYDQTTGLGSVDANSLATEWESSFTVSASPSSLSIAPGSSATATVQINRLGNFSGAVTLSCSVSSGLANTTCSVPSSVTGGTATLTVQTTAAARLTPAIFHRFPPILSLAAFGTLALALTLSKRRRLVLWTAVAGSILIVAGCGGSTTPATPNVTQSFASTPESGTVTVTATAGTVKQTSVVTVNVT